MLSHLPEPFQYQLLQLINLIWSTSSIPSSWQHATLTPILKPSQNPCDPSSYRPISLLDAISKVVTRMVSCRLRSFLNDNSCLSPRQSGFRPLHSTTDVAMRLVSSIKSALDNDEYTLALFFDIQKAYDTVWHNGLLFKLRSLGVPRLLYSFIVNFLSHRTCSTRVSETISSPLPLSRGVPQGDPLSCDLFLVFINDIPLTMPGVDHGMFADDPSVWMSDPLPPLLFARAQCILRGVEEWGNRWQTRFAPMKSNYTLFSNSGYIPNCQLKLYGTVVPYSANPKVLGVTLDSKLSFTTHIHNIVERSTNRLRLLKALTSRRWGANRNVLRLLYVQYIRPVMEYMAPVWLPFVSEPCLHRLQKIQNQAVRVATGCLVSTPSPHLNVELNVPPIRLRLLQLCLAFYHRVYGLPPSHPLRVDFNTWACTSSCHPFFQFCSSVLRQLPLLPTHTLSSIIKHQWVCDWRKVNGSRLVTSYSHITSPYRPMECLLAQLRTGHVRLRHFLFRKFKSVLSPNCECGHEETVSHVLLHCPQYQLERQTLLARCSDVLGIPVKEITLRHLLGDQINRKAFPEVVTYLRTFLKSTKLEVFCNI